MKTIIYTKYGPQDVLHFKEANKPVPEDSQVCVLEHDIDLNPGKIILKKMATVMTLCCFLFVFTFMAPKQVLADDPTVPIVIVSALVVCFLFIGLPLLNESNASSDMEKTYNPKLYKWTYDNMLSEKGTPAEAVYDNNIIAAYYYSAEDVTVGNTVYHPGNFLSDATSETETKAIRHYHGYKYNFFFNRNKKTLVGWQCVHMNDDGVSSDWNASGGTLIQPVNVKNYTPGFDETAGTAPARSDTDQKRQELEDRFKSGAISRHEYMKALAQLTNNTGAAAGEQTKSTDSAAPTLKQKLSELKMLLDSGEITKEEYDKTRAKLIDNFK